MLYQGRRDVGITLRRAKSAGAVDTRTTKSPENPFTYVVQVKVMLYIQALREVRYACYGGSIMLQDEQNGR